MNNKFANTEKAIALMHHLKSEGEDYREIFEYSESSYDNNIFESGNTEYMVLTDSEAMERAEDYITESVWAFNKSFLNCHSEVISEMDTEVFSHIQEMCEGANNTITKLIDDMPHFIEDAIVSDGRGHFLSSYDGEEYEQQINGTWYFIYRIN